MKLRVSIILFFTFFGVANAQTFSSPNLYIDNSSVLTNQVSVCTQTVTIVAKLTVADSNGISSSEIPTPSLYYGNYNTTQVDVDFSQWSLDTGDYYNGTYTATLTIDPSSFMAGRYGLKYGTWRTSTSSRYGYYDGALILKNECSTSISMYHYKFEDNITNSGVGSNGDGTNNYPSWSWSFTDDRFSTNKSLNLNGSMYVDLNSNLKLKTSYNQGITLSAWVYIENNTSVDSFRYIVDLTDGNSNNNWDSRVLMALTPSSTIKLGTNHDGVLDGSQNFNVESLSVNSGEWINVVGVWDLDNDELSIYINGAQQNNSTDISSINSLDLSGGANGGGSKRIGQRVFSDSNSTGWIGKIDDVKFYNTALTSSTILNLYHANKADSVAPTVVLTDTDSDNIVSNSNVVTITATFSESMSATPTISLTGIVANAEMTATSSSSVWTYSWTVSTTETSVTATVSGTDLSGNSYSGSDNILFTIDNSPPEIKMTSPTGYEYVGYYNEHFYFINSGTSYGPKLSWTQAILAANTFLTDFTLSTQKAEGGLVVINSSDENNFIGNYLSDSYSDNSVWTGIYQDNDNSSWINRLGESQTYFSWRSDQPSGTNQNAVLFTADPSVQSSSFTSESNVWTDEDSSNSNDYIVEIDNFYFEDNANSTKIHFYAQMETLTWSLSGDDATFFEIDDSDQSGSAQSIFIDFKSAYQGNLTHSNPQDFNADNIYKFILNVSDAQSNTTSVVINFKLFDTTNPSVTLTNSDSDNIVSNSDVVTITANFSESMSVTPTISLSGIISNVNMTPIKGVELLNSSLWSNNEPNHLNNLEDYGEITNGKLNDIPNGINNSAIIEFYDNRSVAISDYTYVGSFQGHSYYTRNSGAYWNVCKEEATSLGGSLFIINSDAEFDYVKSIISNIDYHIGLYQDTNDSNYSEPDGGWKWIKENSLWNYSWTVSGSTVTSTTATVSGTDLAGNAYTGTDSITFTIDNSNPSLTIIKPTGTYTNQSVVVTLTYDEAVTGLTTDTSQFSEATNIASLTLLSVSSDYKTYTVRITPSSDGLVKLTHAPNSPPVTDTAGNPIASTVSCSFIYDSISPTVTLTDTDLDNIVSNSDVVTITATFSESMKATPTLSLSGITSNVLMSSTGSESVWTYNWNINNFQSSTTIKSIPFEVYFDFETGDTDTNSFSVSNNYDLKVSYNSTTSISSRFFWNETSVDVAYIFDKSFDEVKLNDLSGYYFCQHVNDSNSSCNDTDSPPTDFIVVYKTSEGNYFLVEFISETNSESRFKYKMLNTTATVSGTDLAGNVYAGTDSTTFAIDNTAPTVTLTDTDSDNIVSNSDVVTITATFSESMSATPTLSLTGIVSDAQMSATASDSVWTYHLDGFWINCYIYHSNCFWNRFIRKCLCWNG
jgi:hypothetical protein